MRKLFVPLVLATVALFAIQVAPGHAHGYLVRSIPQDREVVARAPARVQIWFSEGLEPRFSTLTVTDRAGRRVDLGDGGVVAGNRSQLVVRLQPGLPDGVYTAAMRVAFSSDGHIQTDSLVFWVGAQTGSDIASGVSQDVYGLEVAARTLVNIGLLALFGGLFAFRFVFRPAWYNPAYPAGGLAPRILDRLAAVLAAAFALAVIGDLVWLFQQSMVLFTSTFDRVLTESQWLTVLNSTQFGDTWKLRMALLVAVAALVYAGRRLALRTPRLLFLFWSFASVIAAAVLGTLSMGSHAPGATLWPLAAIGIDWIHLLAAGAWVGGLAVVALVTPAALQPLDPDGRRLALLAVLRRFSPIALVSVGLMAVSGAYAAFTYLYTPDQTVTTAYGRTLAGKIILVLPLLGLGAIHRQAIRPGAFKEFQGRLSRSLAAEALLGCVVLAVAGLLAATPPPLPANARARAVIPVYAASQGSLSAALSVNPGGPGSNTYDIQLTRQGTPLDNAQVSVQFVMPEFGRRPPRLALDPAGDGLYIGAGVELSRGGGWQALIDVTAAGETAPTRLAVSWELPEQVAGPTDRVPGILNWLSAAAVVGALLIFAVRWTRRQARKLKLDPQSVAIGLGAALLTVIVLAGATVVIAGSSAAFEAGSNPRPAFVNSVLPDQASIERGSRIFSDQCASCHAAPAALAPYLSSHGDSDVFRFLSGTSSHPYGKALADADRWSLINGLRYQSEAQAR